MRAAVKVTEIIAALEREAADDDTDPRWLAARCLKYIEDWERRTLMVDAEDGHGVAVQSLISAKKNQSGC
jgi:hypothetical protein